MQNPSNGFPWFRAPGRTGVRSGTWRSCVGLGLAGMLVLTSACGDENADLEGDTAVRVVHAAPQAAAVDVYAQGDETPLFEDLAFTETSSFVELEPATVRLEVRPADAAPDSEPLFTSQPVALEADVRNTIVAAGNPAAEEDSEAFRLLAFNEDFREPDADNAVVRLVHGAATAPTVDVDIGNDGSAEVENLERFAATGPGGIQVPAAQPLRAGLLAGDPRQTVAVYTLPELGDGDDAFLIVTGDPEAAPTSRNGLSILAVGPDGTIGRVLVDPILYILHGSPDAPAVDIRVNELLLAQEFNFAELSNPVFVPPGTVDLDLFAAGADDADPAATLSAENLERGDVRLAVISGFLAPEEDQPDLRLSLFAPEFDEDTQLRLVHLVPDAPPVSIGIVSGPVLVTPPVVEEISFGDATGPGQNLGAISAGTTLGLAPTGLTDPAATFVVPDGTGARSFAVLVGALAPAPDESEVRLVLIDTALSPWGTQVIAP